MDEPNEKQPTELQQTDGAADQADEATDTGEMAPAPPETELAADAPADEVTEADQAGEPAMDAAESDEVSEDATDPVESELSAPDPAAGEEPVEEAVDGDEPVLDAGAEDVPAADVADVDVVEVEDVEDSPAASMADEDLPAADADIEDEPAADVDDDTPAADVDFDDAPADDADIADVDDVPADDADIEDIEDVEEAPVVEMTDEETLAAASEKRGEPVSMMEYLMEEGDFMPEKYRRGDLVEGRVLRKDKDQIILDIGAKQEGVVPNSDLARLPREVVDEIVVGETIQTVVIRPEGREGEVLVSINQARTLADWDNATDCLDSGEIMELEIVGYNKGGALVGFGNLQGFVPRSHLVRLAGPRGGDDVSEGLAALVGDNVPVKVIEVSRRKRRLIMSERLALREWRSERKQRLLEQLREGEIRKGRVSSIADFGAFVDLGGADGLVHVSELTYERGKHPRDVVTVGQEVEVYVLNIDRDRKRIGLSMKRLQSDPWETVEEDHYVGELVEANISNLAKFGAFARLEDGLEGLIHISELSDEHIEHPREAVRPSQRVTVEIISIEPHRQRIGLSIRRVPRHLRTIDELPEELHEAAEELEAEAEEAAETAVALDAAAEVLAEEAVELEHEAEEAAEAAVELEAAAEAMAETSLELEAEAEAAAEAAVVLEAVAVEEAVEAVELEAEAIALEAEAEAADEAEAESGEDAPETDDSDVADSDEGDEAADEAADEVADDSDEGEEASDDDADETDEVEDDADEADEVDDDSDETDEVEASDDDADETDEVEDDADETDEVEDDADETEEASDEDADEAADDDSAEEAADNSDEESVDDDADGEQATSEDTTDEA